MAGSGGGLGAWGSLVLLGLCSWTWTGSAAPNAVRNLTVVAQTNSSITLTWEDPEAPEDPNTHNFTYRVHCTGNDGRNVTQNTTAASATVDGLTAGTLYTCHVWVEREGLSSPVEIVTAATAPNAVRNLRVVAQTNSSITLTWEDPEAPEDPNTHNFTYQVHCTGNDGRNVTQNTTAASATVDGLTAGTLYTCHVWVEQEGLSSPVEIVTAATAPNVVRNLRVVAQTNSSITLTWEDPEAPEDPNTHNFTYQVHCTGNDGRNVTQNTTAASATVDGLTAGTLYTCHVWVEQEGLSSPMEIVTAATAPNAVRNLRVVAQTNSSITLTWEDPEAPEDPNTHNFTYQVHCTGNDGRNVTQNTTAASATVDGLTAGTLYTCHVWVEQEGLSSPMEIVTAATAPNAVRNLRVVAQTNSSITLTWEDPEAPEDPNTHNFTYQVHCTGNDGRNVTQNTTAASATVVGLTAGTSYTCHVWVEQEGLSSPVEIVTAATAPSEVVGLHNVTQTSRSVTLRWTAPSDLYSEGYVYRVQWIKDKQPQRKQDPRGDGASQTDRLLDTWYNVTDLEPGTLYVFSVWAEMNNVTSSTQSLRASTVPAAVAINSCVSTSGGYAVILNWSCPQGGFDAFQVQVGGNIIKEKAICNIPRTVGELQPARAYKATVTTLRHGLSASAASTTCHTESGGVIAGSIVGILLFLVLVGLLVFFLKNRQKKKSQEKAAPRNLTFSFPGDIPAQDFPEHVRRQGKDSNYGFAEEYQQLALEGQGLSQLVASAPENVTKNRYRNVLPYDSSRVPLKPLLGGPGSDYINASFLPGLWGPKEFIAAQGPLPHTVGDFWRLVWEQQSQTLVMLTNCVESGQVKCEHYWPLDAQPCTHGQLRVTLLAEEVTENWAVRDLQLLHVDEQKTLSTRQFHYLAWPDHGVPHSPDPLLAFWKILRQWLDQTAEGGPPIVHCSAGVGRTGTLIALDVLLRQLAYEGALGPFNFVKKMRESRPLMVQTEAQYVFLHQCILRFLQQSAPAQQLAADDPMVDHIYENVAALQALESES
ncbi:receptor-type tyrosine-protein phosphatase H [Ochotona princeps]|uniref:receptor-type tyrosine-protein phosphatase H n=1 Tax=Ochotona princeps TaxID=9978 RepID=UPI00271521F7|nr:receptor-type tyrosine-protein phosphatase H [Ochotona princeps]